MRAFLTLDLIPNWEFETVIGVSPEEIRSSAERWTTSEASEEDRDLARVVLSNLVGYPHGDMNSVETATGLSLEELNVILERL